MTNDMKKQLDETIEICLIQRFKTNKAINVPTNILKALNKPKKGVK